MSRFDCICGFEVRNSQYPSTHEGNLVTDIERDDGLFETVSDFARSRQVLECPRCFRIWIQARPNEPTFVPYLPERVPIKLAEQQGGYRG